MCVAVNGLILGLKFLGGEKRAHKAIHPFPRRSVFRNYWRHRASVPFKYSILNNDVHALKEK